jgi:hypothetical protein
MIRHYDLHSIIGLTISDARHVISDPDLIGLFFTDDTYIIFTARAMYEAAPDVIVHQRPLTLSDRLDFKIISGDEFKREKKKADDEKKVLEEKQERELFEKLKAKFQK